MISYDLSDGNIIWECSGLTDNAIPCPVVEDGAVYCMTGYQGFSLLALPLSARGDISGSDKILWSKSRATPYVPSPVLYDGLLYFVQSNQAILTCVDAKTGSTLIEHTRLPELSNVYASLVGAGNHVYIIGRYARPLFLSVPSSSRSWRPTPSRIGLTPPRPSPVINYSYGVTAFFTASESSVC